MRLARAMGLGMVSWAPAEDERAGVAQGVTASKGRGYDSIGAGYWIAAPQSLLIGSMQGARTPTRIEALTSIERNITQCSSQCPTP